MSSISLIKDANGSTGLIYRSVNITGQTTTLVKTGGGLLHSITLNNPVATGTIKFNDALTDTTPVLGIITTKTSPMPVTLVYDIEFAVGLTIVTGTASQDITIAYL